MHIKIDTIFYLYAAWHASIFHSFDVSETIEASNLERLVE